MRPILPEEQVHPDIAERLGGNQVYIEEIRQAIHKYPVVVVGMAQNPFVKKARRLLIERDVSFHYLEYGSYLSQWRNRLAIKMWSGFQTFPQIFVAGTLIGGFNDLQRLLDSEDDPISQQLTVQQN